MVNAIKDILMNVYAKPSYKLTLPRNFIHPAKDDKGKWGEYTLAFSVEDEYGYYTWKRKIHHPLSWIQFLKTQNHPNLLTVEITKLLYTYPQHGARQIK